jgi:hypothetical protein
MPVRLEAALLAGMMLAPLIALADTAEITVAAYNSNVRKAYTRETKSQCFARMRTTTDEIIVCGELDRKDRYRITKGGYVLPSIAIIQSPAERFLETKALIAASQSNIGTGYTSSLVGIKRGYLRGSYKLASKLAAGEDPDADGE